jgi:hypothetical protein
MIGRPFVVLFFALFLPGCIIIPTPQHYVGGRFDIDYATISSLSCGTTGKEDVLLKLGEPDLVVKDERVLGYRWQKAQAYFFVGGPGGGGGRPIMTTYLLLLEFDEKNVLLRAELKPNLLFTTRSTLDEALRW